MGAGEDVMFPYLNARLLSREWSGDKNRLADILNSDEFSVPQGAKELQASQNLFWLKAGAEREFYPGDHKFKNTDKQLLDRMDREKMKIGLWGSEQMSPIYHPFILTGQLAVFQNTSSLALKLAIVENMSSFFWLAREMGFIDGKHGLVGQRGAGHDHARHGHPELHHIVSLLYENGSGFQRWMRTSGWVMALKQDSNLLSALREHAPSVSLVKPSISIHFFSDDNGPLGHYMEYATNGNTPEVGGFMYPSSYLPVNVLVRVRQKPSKGSYGHEVKDGKLHFRYTGLYTSLPGSPGNPQVITSRPIVGTLKEKVIGLHSNWTGHVPASPQPQEPSQPTVTEQPEEKKPSWIERMGL